MGSLEQLQYVLQWCDEMDRTTRNERGNMTTPDVTVHHTGVAVMERSGRNRKKWKRPHCHISGNQA